MLWNWGINNNKYSKQKVKKQKQNTSTKIKQKEAPLTTSKIYFVKLQDVYKVMFKCFETKKQTNQQKINSRQMNTLAALQQKNIQRFLSEGVFGISALKRY